MANLETVVSFYNKTKNEYLNDLVQLVKIPSVSFDGFDKKEVIQYIENQPRLLRPANYAPDTPGRGMWLGASASTFMNANNTFINNTIPAACIDPVAAKILGLVPPANNIPASGLKNVNNFANIRNLLDNADGGTGRLDWSVNNSNNVFVRYTNSHRLRFVPGTLQR